MRGGGGGGGICLCRGSLSGGRRSPSGRGGGPCENDLHPTPWIDKHLWKHYLPATSFAGGKMSVHFFGFVAVPVSMGVRVYVCMCVCLCVCVMIGSPVYHQTLEIHNTELNKNANNRISIPRIHLNSVALWLFLCMPYTLYIFLTSIRN